VPAPVTESLAVVAALTAAAGRAAPDALTDNVVLPSKSDVLPPKLALFNLQKYIKENDFAVEFMHKGGVRLLIDLVESENVVLTGNTLAYALQGIRGVMEYDNGWGDFSDEFIDRIIIILASSSVPNIVRPATVIVRKLIVASPKAASGSAKGKQKARENEAINQYGFDRVFNRICEVGHKVPDDHGGSPADRVFRPIIKRLEGTRDLELVAQSLALINAALRSAQQEGSKRYSDLIAVIEGLGARRHVTRLIPSSHNNPVEPRILDFQTRYANVLRYHSLRPVRPQTNPTHDRYLEEIWHAGRLDQEETHSLASPRPSMQDYHSMRSAGGQRTWEGWRRMGLSIDYVDATDPLSETELFRSVGELGLECLHYYATHEDNFHSVVMEQLARPTDRSCPIGRASAECVKILYDYYKISQSAQRGPSHFQPFMLNFPRLHSFVLKFFLRMWQDSESRLDDFERLSYLVRSQVRITLDDEQSKTWLDLERDFLGSDYRNIRDVQMEMIDKEDGLLERPAISVLRDKVKQEAVEVMLEQRVICMQQGAWFNAAHVLTPGMDVSVRASTSRPHRFVRLSPNRRTLAWAEYPQRLEEKPTFESLKDKSELSFPVQSLTLAVELSAISEIKTQTGCAVGSRAPDTPSKNSFSIMSGGTSLLDLNAIHIAQFAEWTDGLRVLKGSGMATQESTNYTNVSELAPYACSS
jgi:hypothetical protein